VDGFRRVEIVVLDADSVEASLEATVVLDADSVEASLEATVVLDADSVEASLEATVVIVVLVTVVAPCVNPAAALLYCFTSSYSSTP
jgi:hypothetical protein